MALPNAIAQEGVAPQSRFDVFLSANHRDYPAAETVYDLLATHQRKPFLAPRSLPVLRITDYLSEIEKVIGEVQHFVTVVGKPEHLETGWVRAERVMFLNELWSGRKRGNFLTVKTGDVQESQLPTVLRSFQVVPLQPLDRILDFLPSVVAPVPVSDTSAGGVSTAGKSPTPGTVPPEPLTWHKLHQFPRGPMVSERLITSRLVKAYADRFATPQQIGIALKEANEYRVEADPDAEASRISMMTYELPPPGHGVAALQFWQNAWALARVKGPRMVGALLLLLEREEFDSQTQRDVSTLIDSMRRM